MEEKRREEKDKSGKARSGTAGAEADWDEALC